MMKSSLRLYGCAALLASVSLLGAVAPANTQQRQKPNILVIWGDDIGGFRSDPFERAEYEGMGYNQWYLEHMFAIAPAAAYVGQWLQSFREFPPRQKPGSFNLERVMEAVTAPYGGKSD